jgi:hypothetical protein
MNENPYHAPRAPSSNQPPSADTEAGLRHARWLNWLAGVLLVVGVYFTVECVEPLRRPHRFHGFEVTMARLFVVAGPLMMLGGLLLISRFIVKNRSRSRLN